MPFPDPFCRPRTPLDGHDPGDEDRRPADDLIPARVALRALMSGGFTCDNATGAQLEAYLKCLRHAGIR